MSMEAPSRAAEWRAHWPVVLVAFVGFSFPAMALHSTGLVIEPLSREFGWSRTQITAGVTLAGVMTIPLSPFVGALIDRWGVRRLALPGVILTSLAIAGFSLANGAFWQWMGLWFLFGLAGLLVKSTIWMTAVTSSFTTARSLALGVALGGTAFASALTPPLTRWITDTYGWREAYAWLGLGWGLPTFVLTLFFLFDARDRGRRAKAAGASAEPAPDLPGLSIQEAARSLALIRVGLATLITLVLGASLVVHKVPILTEAGVTRETAALLASLSGIAAILGKLVTGWLMERFDAGLIGGITNSVTALALVLLLEPFRTPTLIVVAMVVVGYAGGTKLQICAYLTSIYAGMKNFGKIFGVMASIISLAGSLGPLLGGIAYDVSGSYDLLILIGIPASLVGGLLLVRLGPFPEWSRALEAAPRGARVRNRPQASPAEI
jgi:predicted MFS family arabinose efflux permease